MKILFIAVFTPNSTNVSQSRGFKENGCEIIEYDYRKKLIEFNSIEKRDDDIINLVNTIKPNLVLFSKCNMMHYRVVEECNKISKTALWYMDAMYNFDSELIDKIKRVNYFFCGVEGVIPNAEKYNKNSIFIHQCPDEKMNFKINDHNCTFIDDITFIGSVDSTQIHSDRLKYINRLKNEFNGFKHYNNVFGLKHNEIVNCSKINLNFSPTDSSGVSVRIFKILSSGGFLMTTPWTDMEKTFTPDKDIVIFNNEDELVEKIKYYLTNENDRIKISTNGYQKVREYLPKNWSNKIINYVNG
jgi:hypothetical protein